MNARHARAASLRRSLGEALAAWDRARFWNENASLAENAGPPYRDKASQWRRYAESAEASARRIERRLVR